MGKRIWIATITLSAVLAIGLLALMWSSFGNPSGKDRIAELTTISSETICREPVAVASALKTSGKDDALPIHIEIGPAFRLVDQNRQVRTRDNLIKGRLSLLIFGYGSCEGVCLQALPAMAGASDILRERGVAVQPVLVTVDPERDTPEALAAGLRPIHKDFVGLTGPLTALAAVRRMFSVKANPAYENENGTVFQHGSYIFVIDAEGRVQSLLPPVLPPRQIADIAQKYAP